MGRVIQEQDNPPHIEPPASEPPAPSQDNSNATSCHSPSIGRYGLPEPDALGLHNLHQRIRRDFSSSTTYREGSVISRDSSAGSLFFEGDSRRNRRHLPTNEDTESEEELDPPTQRALTDAAGLPPRWVEEPLRTRQFIHDMSAEEKLSVNTGVMSISQDKQRVEIHAGKSQAFYELVAANTKAVGMKMNALKTQLLCISTSINYEVRSFIYIDGHKITSGDEMKLLGFYFGLLWQKNKECLSNYD